MGIGHPHYDLGSVHEEASLVKDVLSGSVPRVCGVAEAREHFEVVIAYRWYVFILRHFGLVSFAFETLL